MASIRDIIYRAGLARPDVYPEEIKARWLMELDGKLKEEVILRHRLTAGRASYGPVGECPRCGSSDGLYYNKYLDMSRCECGWDSSPEVPERYPDDLDMELLVGAPWDGLYDRYLAAQIDLYNRENDNYNDSASLFEQAKDEWQRAYHQSHMPVSRAESYEWRAV